MSPSLVLELIARRARLLAVILVAALVGAFAATTGGSHQHVRLLGPRGLLLAAFDGKASLLLTASSTDGDVTIAKPGVALQSFSWSVSTQIDAASGQAAGRRQFVPITITKRLDQTSPKLMLLINNNEVLKTAQITISRAVAGKVAETLTFKMTNVLVTSLHETATDNSSSETVSMAAQKIAMEYTKAGSTPIVTSVQPYPPVG